MNNCSKSFLLLFFLFTLHINIFAQNKIMALRQSAEQGFTFINRNGDVLFSLPPGHTPTVREKREPFTLGNFYEIDFSTGFLPVKGDDTNYYLINKKGEKVRDMGDNFNWISKFQGGFFRGFERFEGKRNTSMIIYLDKAGNPSFGEKKYWQGSRFREGKAIVQLEDKEGDWLLIDSTGKVMVNLSKNLEGEIIMLHKFKYGFWNLGVNKSKTSWKHGNLYVRPNGEYSEKKSDFMPKPSARSFPPQLHPELAINPELKKRFKEAAGFLPPPSYTTKNYGYFIFDDGERLDNNNRRGILYDHNYQIISLVPEGEDYKINPLRFYGKYLMTAKMDESGKVSTLFFNTENILIPQLELEGFPRNSNLRVEDDLVFIQERGVFSTMITVKKIARMSGEIIYEPDLTKKAFTSLKNALKTPKKVSELHLKELTENELLQLKNFPNLEVLKLKEIDVKSIPEGIFSSFPLLRSLQISYFKYLEKLPADAKTLTNLTKAQIYDCPKLKEVEVFFSAWTSLRKFKCDFLKREQLSELKRKFPKVNFEPMLVMEVPGN